MMRNDVLLTTLALAGRFNSSYRVQELKNRTNLLIAINRQEGLRILSDIVRDFWQFVPFGANVVRTGQDVHVRKGVFFHTFGFIFTGEKAVNETFDLLRLQPDSSNVDVLQYNREEKWLDVRFHSGEVYRYFDIDYRTFENVWKGRATCTTKGSSPYGNWWIDKNPSTGSAVWEYLRRTKKDFQKL